MNISRFFSVAVSYVILLSSQILSAAQYNYAEVLQKSMWFYEVQRSGPLTPENNRVEWRGSSAVNDGSDVGVDLSGGWYDAGDNMKFNFPMCSAVTLLAWGGLENGAGYQKYGQWGYLLGNIKWVTDYLIKCHTKPHEFYGQIGIGMTDHKWWGSPEVYPNERPAFKIDEAHPGSDLAAEAAAALASSSMLFRAGDPAYADKLLEHAKELYDFADKYRGLYSNAITDAADFYKSWSGYMDELVWGAAWLYLATGDSKYLTRAETLYDSLGYENQTTIPKYKEALSWDDKTYGCYVLLAKITNKSRYHQDARRWLNWWSCGFASRQAGKTTWSNDSGVAYTPSGLAWIRDWGPIRYAANCAFAALAYIKCKDVPSAQKTLYYNWAKSQIDFALGNNEQKRSYVCGFGTNPPVKPHHRSMHGPYLDDNGRTPVNSRHVLYGALVGGPGSDGSYADDRLDATKNEVATDYNAGFSSALAQFVADNNCSPLSDFPQPAKRDTEYTVVAKINTQGDRFSEISATVQNKTTWPARYSKNLTIKYFFDPSEILNAGYSLSDIKLEKRGICVDDNGITLSALKQYSQKQNLYYVEVSFAGDTIFPGGQSAHRREVQFRIGLADTAPQKLWDASNDPSFTGLTCMVDTTGDVNIPAYEDGVLVWGKEPDGTSFTPPTWNMPAFKEPQYSLSGWNRALLLGESNQGVEFFNIKHSMLSPFTIVRRGNNLSIHAFSDLEVGIFGLDGKKVGSFSIKKGRMSTISNKKAGKSFSIIQIDSGNERSILKTVSY